MTPAEIDTIVVDAQQDILVAIDMLTEINAALSILGPAIKNFAAGGLLNDAKGGIAVLSNIGMLKTMASTILDDAKKVVV